MEEIRTRFAPSPTGYLHVGGARTALFNWLYARKTGGKFVLRIEDTDTERSTQASVDAIFESLEWLGIDWDEGPFYQTKRFDLYREYIQKLLDSDKAYYCTCTPEEIDAMREKARAEGRKPKYDGSCREKGLQESDNAVIRFKAPLMGATVMDDIIKGSIAFQNTELDDFIIQRTDKTPTYNMAVVVDDITMNINHVIRGDDHVNNTPKQIMLYNALGAELPKFGHVPMVLGSDKSRLSKRHGAMSVSEYRDMGFLPDAVLNYLVRLGWSFGDQEFFTIPELKEKFTLKNIGRSPSVFDKEKMLSLNGDHIQASEPLKIAELLLPLLIERDCDVKTAEELVPVVKCMAPRSKTIIEMADTSLYFFKDFQEYDEKSAKKAFKEASLEPLKKGLEIFGELNDYSHNEIEKAFHQVLESTGLKFGKAGPPIRVALTGTSQSPGIFDIIEILGKELTLLRLEKAINYIESKIQ